MRHLIDRGVGPVNGILRFGVHHAIVALNRMRFNPLPAS